MAERAISHSVRSSHSPACMALKTDMEWSRRLIFYLFNAAWTATFSSAYVLWMLDAGGGVYWLASAASSVFWLLVTTALWVRPMISSMKGLYPTFV
jgi:hypothetical protein